MPPTSGMFSGIPGRRPLNRDFTGKTGILGRYVTVNHAQLQTRFAIKVQGIRNDDLSLSPVTPLVSLLFLSFLII